LYIGCELAIWWVLIAEMFRIHQFGAFVMSITLDLKSGISDPVSSNTAQAELSTKPNLIGMDRQEMAAALEQVGIPQKQLRMRVNQIWQWVYVRGVTDFSNMSNISKDLRSTLDKHFTLARPEIVEEQISTDGTRKWLFRFPSGGAGKPVEVETVYIPEENRGTLCISSQVGCTLNCTFCHTGTQKLVRNLTPEEILMQLMVARDRLGDFAAVNAPVAKNSDDNIANRLVTNIVMMGMGEPLYNFDNVKKALLIAIDGDGLALSRRRVTLSTSGVVPGIMRTGEEIGVMLAISLHATNDTLRNELVPINKKYPLKELMDACRNYEGLSNARRITFEYVMLKGINDSLNDAKQLVSLLKGIPAKINLIPFNPWPGSGYECSDWEQIEKFSDFVNQCGYASPIRTPRGRDIFAACGQLKSESERLRIRERQALEGKI